MAADVAPERGVLGGLVDAGVGVVVAVDAVDDLELIDVHLERSAKTGGRADAAVDDRDIGADDRLRAALVGLHALDPGRHARGVAPRVVAHGLLAVGAVDLRRVHAGDLGVPGQLLGLAPGHACREAGDDVAVAMLGLDAIALGDVAGGLVGRLRALADAHLVGTAVGLDVATGILDLDGDDVLAHLAVLGREETGREHAREQGHAQRDREADDWHPSEGHGFSIRGIRDATVTRLPGFPRNSGRGDRKTNEGPHLGFRASPISDPSNVDAWCGSQRCGLNYPNVRGLWPTRVVRPGQGPTPCSSGASLWAPRMSARCRGLVTGRYTHTWVCWRASAP